MAYLHVNRLSLEEIRDLPEALTTKEASGVTGKQPNTLQVLARQGRIPATKLGSRLVFSKSALCKFAGIEIEEAQ